jgi:molybdopterin-guanine dinucleotide biosynthesis protein A
MEVAPSSDSHDEILGVVLAGGSSRRMGDDKGTLEVQKLSLSERAFNLLTPFCRQVIVSVRREQSRSEPYRHLPLVFDQDSVSGPVAGLLAAFASHPDHAILVVAVDMPLVDEATIECLIQGRRPARMATAFRHSSGIVEPLCAIYEPSAAAELERIATATGSVSLRKWLGIADIGLIDPPNPRRLVSVNTPSALQEARAAIGEH